MMICACRVGMHAVFTRLVQLCMHLTDLSVSMLLKSCKHTDCTMLTACAHDLYLLFALGCEVWVIRPTGLRTP